MVVEVLKDILKKEILDGECFFSEEDANGAYTVYRIRASKEEKKKFYTTIVDMNTAKVLVFSK